jgi:hypothetical protein
MGATLVGLPNAIFAVYGFHDAEAGSTQDPAPDIPNILRIVDKEDEWICCGHDRRQ